MGSNKTIYIIVALVAVALIYFKFFHRKGQHPMVAGTPAVKKKGGGGWRHRFSHLAKGVAGNALKMGSMAVPGGSAALSIGGQLTHGVV